MKAFICDRYGSPDVLQLKNIDTPEPGPNEVLIKIQAASLNAADWHMMRGDPFVARLMMGISKPKFPILGADISGRVEAVGKNVQEFREGDEVFGDLSQYNWGGFAEYVCVREQDITHKPRTLSHGECAAVPLAGITALQALRNVGQLTAGQKVLVNGSSGGVGTFALQIAKLAGADVTAVCSTAKVEQSYMLGADRVIDYTKKNFTENGARYDLILVANGHDPIQHYKRVLTDEGRCVVVGGSTKQFFEAMTIGPLISRKNGKKFKMMLAKPNKNDLRSLKELVESGKIKPVMDRNYLFDEIPDAMRYLEDGHAKGKIVINVS